MQSETIQQPKSLNQFTETRERAKFEGREGDEEQATSEPSTIQSLGDIGEQSSTNETPKSTELLQKGFHKVTDAIAQGVEGVKNLVFVDQTKQDIKEGASNIQKDIKQKAEELKGKVTEKIGEGAQPEKDLGQETNEEARQQPSREQGLGQGEASKSDVPSAEDLKQGAKGIVNKASEKVNEIKDKVTQQGQESKQEGGQTFESNYQAPKETKEGKEVNQDLVNQDLRFAPKEVFDKALEKIEEMREKASQEGEQLKQGAKEAANQISDKVQDFKTGGSQFSAEQNSQPSGEQTAQENHEHHQLSAESPSFQPTEETHQLIEAVKEGLEEQVPLTEKVQEFESHQHESPQKEESYQSQAQQRERGQPGFDQVKQGAQQISNKISEKIEEVKGKFTPGTQEKGQLEQERQPGQEMVQPQSQGFAGKISEKVENVKNKFASEEKGGLNQARPPSQETVQPQSQGFTDKISEKVENVKDKFTSENQERTQGQETFQNQAQEKGQQVAEQVKGSAQQVSDKIDEKVQDVKANLNLEQGQFSGGQEESQGEQVKERLPLVDQVIERIHAVNENIHHSVENVKNAFKVEERTDDRKPLLDVVSETISKITHGIEVIKNKVRPTKEERPGDEGYEQEGGNQERLE